MVVGAEDVKDWSHVMKKAIMLSSITHHPDIDFAKNVQDAAHVVMMKLQPAWVPMHQAQVLCTRRPLQCSRPRRCFPGREGRWRHGDGIRHIHPHVHPPG